MMTMRRVKVEYKHKKSYVNPYTEYYDLTDIITYIDALY